MAILRPADIPRLLAAPDFSRAAILVHGPDQGLVHERATMIAHRAEAHGPGTFSIQRLDAGELERAPGRLAELIRTIPMFGGRPFVWLRDQGEKASAKALSACLEMPELPGFILIESGELGKRSALRQLVEKHAACLSVACYRDNATSLARLIDEEAARHGLEITPDARHLLRDLLGGDRLASRSEMTKLSLYAGKTSQIGVADVRAVIGDASALELDDVIDAVALGDVRRAGAGQRRLIGSGMRADMLAARAMRHFRFLHNALEDRAAGIATDTIMSRARPPVFFNRRDAVRRQIARCRPSDIRAALRMVDAAILAARQMPTLSSAIIGQALLTCALTFGAH